MQVLKITFIIAFAFTLSSFAFRATTEYGREQLYKDFLSEFKSVELPSTITFESIMKNELVEENDDSEIVSKKNTRKILNSKYSTFIPAIDDGMISRMGPSTYEAEALLVSKDNGYNTVVYSRSNTFSQRSKTYILATFDKEGKEISTNYCGYSGPNCKVEFIANKDMAITVNSLVKADTDKFEQNDVRKLFIKPNGEILEFSANKTNEKELSPKMKKTPTKMG